MSPEHNHKWPYKREGGRVDTEEKTCDHGGRDCSNEATNQLIPDSSQEPEKQEHSPLL